MPISSHAILPYVVSEFEAQKPDTVLDLGIGNGIFGAMVYNYSEIFMGKMPCLIGVEAWKFYKGPLWDCYTDVFITPIEDYELIEKWDMIVMLDVLEHWNRKDGRVQLERFKKALNPGGVFVVSTPAIFCKQGAYKGNPYEEHKSLWTPEAFGKAGFVPVRKPRLSILGECMLIYKFKQEDKS